MVEKIIVNPQSVRGYGNIVNVHDVSDYEAVGCTILEDTDTINNIETTVYVIEAENTSISVALSSSADSCYIGDSVVLTATVLDDGEPIEGGTVTFKLNTTTLGTDETDANGVATYTVVTSDVGSLNFTAYYEAHNSNTVSVVVSHDYSLAFSQASYTATDGSAEISCTLLDNGVAVSGATISFSGSDSSLYSGITNSGGIATVTVSGVTSDTTFTASYSNVTATCSVTVQSVTVYYESALTSDDGKWQKSSSTGMSISYDATNGCTVTGTTTSDRTYYINTSSVTIPTSDIVVEFDMTGATLGAYNNSTEIVVHNAKILLENANIECRPMNNNEDRTVVLTNPSYPLHFKFEITSSQIKVYYADTLVKTITANSSYRRIGFKTYNQRGASMKNLKVYELM